MTLVVVDNGEAIEEWEDSCDFTLVHDAKLPKSFNSAAWKKGYNPDLIFASECIANSCKKSIMDPIPHTQHRPICVRVEPVVVPQATPFRRRFNLRKADWTGYAIELDKLIWMLNQPRPTTIVSWRAYAWHPEGTSQGDVERNLFPVLLKNQRVSMKHISHNIRTVLSTMEPWNPVMHS